jgi:hypothetical protein
MQSKNVKELEDLNAHKENVLAFRRSLSGIIEPQYLKFKAIRTSCGKKSADSA